MDFRRNLYVTQLLSVVKVWKGSIKSHIFFHNNARFAEAALHNLPSVKSKYLSCCPVLSLARFVHDVFYDDCDDELNVLLCRVIIEDGNECWNWSPLTRLAGFGDGGCENWFSHLNYSNVVCFSEFVGNSEIHVFPWCWEFVPRVKCDTSLQDKNNITAIKSTEGTTTQQKQCDFETKATICFRNLWCYFSLAF